MRKLYACLIGAVICTSLNLHAQTAWPGAGTDDLAPVPAPPDTVVAITAEACGLPQVPNDQLPLS